MYTAKELLNQLNTSISEATDYYSKLQAECKNRVELARCKTRINELRRLEDAVKHLTFDFEE